MAFHPTLTQNHKGRARFFFLTHPASIPGTNPEAFGCCPLKASLIATRACGRSSAPACGASARPAAGLQLDQAPQEEEAAREITLSIFIHPTGRKMGRVTEVKNRCGLRTRSGERKKIECLKRILGGILKAGEIQRSSALQEVANHKDVIS